MENPYAAPAARIDDAPISDPEGVRLPHLQREAALRFIGVLCLVFVVHHAISIFRIAKFLPSDLPTLTDGYVLWMAAIATSIFAPAVLAILAAWGYLRLRPWVLAIGPAFWAIQAFELPFVAPLALLVAFLTWSSYGRRVLAADHIRIREQTRQVRAWRAPNEALVALVLLLTSAAVYFRYAVN